MSIERWTHLFSLLTVVTLLVGVVVLTRDREVVTPAPPAPVSPSTVSAPAVQTAATQASCAQLSNTPAAARDKCYVTTAARLKDASLCSRILVTAADDAGNYTKQSDYNDCMFKVSLALNNVTTCQKVADTNDRYFCIMRLAGAKRDKNLCFFLPDTTNASQNVLWNRASCTLQVDECRKSGANCAQ